MATRATRTKIRRTHHMRRELSSIHVTVVTMRSENTCPPQKFTSVIWSAVIGGTASVSSSQNCLSDHSGNTHRKGRNRSKTQPTSSDHFDRSAHFRARTRVSGHCPSSIPVSEWRISTNDMVTVHRRGELATSAHVRTLLVHPSQEPPRRRVSGIVQRQMWRTTTRRNAPHLATLQVQPRCASCGLGQGCLPAPQRLAFSQFPCVLSKQGCCFFALIRTRTRTRALSQRRNTCSALLHDKPCRWAQSAIHGQCLSPRSTTFHHRPPPSTGACVAAIQHGAYSCGPGGGGAARRRGGSDGAGDAGGACCCCCCCCMPKTGF